MSTPYLKAPAVSGKPDVQVTVNYKILRLLPVLNLPIYLRLVLYLRLRFENIR